MTSADPLAAKPVEVREGIVYAEHDGHSLLADLYMPPGRDLAAGILLFHGGAWTKGKRASYENWGRFLAAEGYVAMAADYRLAGAGAPSFPLNIWDGHAAVQFLRGRSAEYGVDPDRIGVMGGSAGAHLAAMVTLTPRVASLRNPYADEFAAVPSTVSFAICMAGTYDLVQRWEQDQIERPTGENSAELYLGSSPMSVRSRYYEASPIFHASEENARGTRWLLAWGTEDDVTAPELHSIVLSRHLKRAGALVRHAPIVGAPHFWYFEGEVDEGPFLPVFASRLRTFLQAWSGWSGQPSRAPR